MRYDIIPPFPQAVRLALQDTRLHQAIRTTLARLEARRLARWRAEPDNTLLREQVHASRQRTVSELKPLVAKFVSEVERQGGRVHWISSAKETPAVLKHLLGDSLQRVVTVSDILLEELAITQLLRAMGHQVDIVDVEGALLDASGEPPVHPMFPLVHMSTRDVARTISKKWNQPSLQGATALLQRVTNHVEAVCKNADVAILMGHFAVAESGAVVVLDQDGTRVWGAALASHTIVLLGVEQILPSWQDVGVVVRAYESAVPLESGAHLLTLSSDSGGAAQQMDFILVDNGRYRVLNSPDAEALMCIHCGACALACPVFRETGGQVYGTPYVGPIGALLSPYFFEGAGADLARACTLCGACTLACPVGIELSRLMARRRLASRAPHSDRASARALRWCLDRVPVHKFVHFLTDLWSRGGRKGGRVRWYGSPSRSSQSLLELWGAVDQDEHDVQG